MINSELFDLFTQDNIDKQAKIEYSGGVMTNTELFQNSEELTESLCSGNELRFGCCEASCFKFKVYGIVKDMSGEMVSYSMVVDKKADFPLLIGKYKVASDKLTADRRNRQITAYDAMYDILKADVAVWYNSVLPEKTSTMTLKQFRESFVRHFDLTEIVPEDGLVNDNMVVSRTIDPEQISGKDVITAICEINACFGHIGRDGKFHYIYLQQTIGGLYPADNLFPDRAPDYLPNQQLTGHLYPQDPKATIIGSGLRTSPPEYQSYVTQPITKLQIRKEENDIGRIWPDEEVQESDNCYIIQDNFLVYGKSHEELGTIAKNIYGKITNIIYRPFTANCVGNPCFEVGDPICMTTRYDIIESYILKRTLNGVQALRDTYTAEGIKKYGEKVNGVQRSIIQLKGMSNVLTRTVEENRVEMIDITNGLSNTISVTAAGLQANITAEKNRAENEEEKLSNNISVTAAQIRTELTAEYNRAKGEEEKLSNTITATASEFSVKLTAEKTRAEGEEAKLSNQITATASEFSVKLTAEKTRAEGEEAKLSNQITATANEFSVKLSSETSRAHSEEQRIESSVNVVAGKIVLKVDSSGNMALVQLDADPDTGTAFKVNANNINLSASDVINLMSGGTLNLTGKNIAITSDNFKVDSNGNAQFNNITAFSISGNAVNQFNSTVSDTEAMKTANAAISKAQKATERIEKAIEDLNNEMFPEVNRKINELQVEVASLKSRVSALESRPSGGE